MKINKLTMTISACVLLIAAGLMAWHQQTNASIKTNHPKPADTGSKCTDPHEHENGGEDETDSGHSGHVDDHDDHEQSDLDRSMDELWSATCEHDVLHYTCDECRYELGIVKLSDKVFTTPEQAGIVTIVRPEERRMGKSLSLTGEVVTNDLASLRVSSVVSGTIRKIMADIGSRVSAGDLLFELDSTEAAEAKADYLKKAAALNLAKKTAQREENLFAKKIAAEVEVLDAGNKQIEAEIELAGALSRLERMGISRKGMESLRSGTTAAVNGILPVYAARAGVVLERFAGPGDPVEPGREIMLISDISEVWIRADIKETDSALLPLQSRKVPCVVSVPGSDGKTISGMLEAVSAKMDKSTRTIRARISVANPDELLRPGMFVSVVLVPEADGVVLTVPDTSVLSDAGRTFVFVHKEGEYWIRRPVTTGPSIDGYTEIRQGLDKDQTVISDGSFLLKSDVLRSKMGAGCAE